MNRNKTIMYVFAISIIYLGITSVYNGFTTFRMMHHHYYVVRSYWDILNTLVFGVFVTSGLLLIIHATTSKSNNLTILTKRLANGEITMDEYLEIKRELEQ